MKRLPTLLITALSLISTNSFAEAQPFNLDIGIAHKAYSIDIPSQIANSSEEYTHYAPAIGLSIEDEFNEYFSFQFEVAKGYESEKTSAENFSNGTTTSEVFDTQLDYSLSVMGKIRPLGIKTLSPVLLLGATTTSISYDYQQSINNVINKDYTETETSSAIQYGVGFELHAADDLNLSISYVDLSRLKLKSSVINFEAVIKI